MSRLNVAARNALRTHEGAPATPATPEQALRRSVMACLLWEKSFYESGEDIAERIATLARQVPAPVLARLAVEARSQMNLRHAPLLLLDALCETGRGTSLVSQTIAEVISRPDEIGEMIAVYWRNGRRPLSAQLKKGIARAFAKFDEYQLAKWGGNK